MNNDKRPLYISYAGPALLSTPLLNKGSAFSAEERASFNLEGLLPEATETIQEQVVRAYQQYRGFESDMDKHIYLRNIQDTNETLFYRLVQNHISEMMPIIYTPTVGAACENFSNIYRRGRGLFISYANRDRIDDLLNNAANHNVKVIVVTDGERILGLATKVSAVWGFLSVNCHFTPLVVALAQRIRFLWFWMWVRITRNVLLTLCTWLASSTYHWT